MGRWFKPEMIAILYINAPAKISHLAVIRRLTNFLFKLIQLKTESLRIGAKSLALNATCAGVGRRNQLLKQHVEQHWYFYWYCYFQDMYVYVYIYIYIYIKLQRDGYFFRLMFLQVQQECCPKFRLLKFLQCAEEDV